MSSISIAVRNRKNDFKEMLCHEIKKRGKDVHIMNLASGACREIKELLEENPKIKNHVSFDCYDTEEDAHAYAKKLIGNKDQNINFFLENALRIAGTQNIYQKINKKYDIIYSIGLFDYLNYKLSVRLLKNLRKILKNNGVMLIADVRDRYLNPSVFYMEWAGDWNLIYRSDEEFRQVFIDAGFKEKDLKTTYEQQGIIQYIKAKY